jgi:hypothetical protein
MAMEKIYSALGPEPTTRFSLLNSSGLDLLAFDRSIEKLQAFNGAEIDCNGSVRDISGGWRVQHDEYRRCKREEIDQMFRFAESNDCRMAVMVSHFDCSPDEPAVCGICDNCLKLGDSTGRVHPADSAHVRVTTSPDHVGEV